jgi:hypothetical protein
MTEMDGPLKLPDGKHFPMQTIKKRIRHTTASTAVTSTAFVSTEPVPGLESAPQLKNGDAPRNKHVEFGILGCYSNRSLFEGEHLGKQPGHQRRELLNPIACNR